MNVQQSAALFITTAMLFKSKVSCPSKASVYIPCCSSEAGSPGRPGTPWSPIEPLSPGKPFSPGGPAYKVKENTGSIF